MGEKSSSASFLYLKFVSVMLKYLKGSVQDMKEFQTGMELAKELTA